MKIREFFQKTEVKVVCAVVAAVAVAGLVIGGVSLQRIHDGVDKVSGAVQVLPVN